MANLGPNIQGAAGQQHINNGEGTSTSFGTRVANWIVTILNWLPEPFVLRLNTTLTILSQMIALVLIGIVIGLIVGTANNNKSKPQPSNIGYSAMSMLNHPFGSLHLGIYDRERAMSTAPSPPPEYYSYSSFGADGKTVIIFENDGKVGWTNCHDNNIKVHIAGENCNDTKEDEDETKTIIMKTLFPGEPCRSNRQVMRGIICSYNAFRFANGIKLWLIVDDNAKDEEMEKAVQTLKNNLIQPTPRNQ